jgi:two-component system, NarL family, sensor kinase
VAATRRRRTSRPAPSAELADLRARLVNAEEALGAIRAGDVDALVVQGKRGARVFTLQGADQSYRVLMEAMNEGALTLTSDKQILYANQRFAGMVHHPLEQVIGGSFRRFLSAGDRATLKTILVRAKKSGAKFQALLNARDGSQMPVQISVRPLVTRGDDGAAVSMVVTDMTDARRSEEALRGLTHRLVQAQESERGSVALELHEHITQLLCAVVLRSRALVNTLSAHDGPSQREAGKLSEMLVHTVEEVERISRDLRPSALEHLGLAAALRSTAKEFTERTGVAMTLARVRMSERLRPETELTLYRIFQEALINVERHARARRVTVLLRRDSAFVVLSIHDDGIGFDAERRPTARRGKRRLGLLSMRERARNVGGTLDVTSSRRTGTRIEVRVPRPGRTND